MRRPIYDRKGKGRAVQKPTKSRRKARLAFVESDDEGDGVSEEDDDDDDMSDLIVGSDEDEMVKDTRRTLMFKRRHGKRRIHVILNSDDEPGTLEKRGYLWCSQESPYFEWGDQAVATILTVKQDEGLSAILLSGIRSSLTVIVQYMMDELLKLQKTKPQERVCC